MPTTTPIRIDSGDMFRITNNDEKSYRFVWDKRTWTVQPGQSTFVPFDVVRVYFGDPRSVIGSSRTYQDSKGKGEINKRENEIERLAILYGLYSDKIRTVPVRVPKFVVTTATGDEVNLPCFDPDGNTAPKNTDAIDINSIEDVGAVIGGLQKQIDELRGISDHLKTNGSNTTTDVEVDGTTGDDGVDFAR